MNIINVENGAPMVYIL